jgi:predicted DNA-binding transcriptional regulator AlpA
MTTDQNDSYLTGPQVDKRFSISAMTRWRWQRNPHLSFPVPIKINNRCYWKHSALDLWERGRELKSSKGLVSEPRRCSHD